uniref:Uncharacterized protein n=1 Tax=Spermophilus dauricus TaxID=99837 RepID=A0A8C9UNY2_SPEDA
MSTYGAQWLLLFLPPRSCAYFKLAILLPQPPKSLGLQVCTTAPNFNNFYYTRLLELFYYQL